MDFSWGAGTMPGIIADTLFSSAWHEGGGANYAIATYTKLYQLSTSLASGGWTLPPNYNETTHIITATYDVEIYEIDYHYSFNNENHATPGAVEAR